MILGALRGSVRHDASHDSRGSLRCSSRLSFALRRLCAVASVRHCLYRRDVQYICHARLSKTRLVRRRGLKKRALWLQREPDVAALQLDACAVLQGMVRLLHLPQRGPGAPLQCRARRVVNQRCIGRAMS